jgi:hypothetical protein
MTGSQGPQILGSLLFQVKKSAENAAQRADFGPRQGAVLPEQRNYQTGNEQRGKRRNAVSGQKTPLS